MRRRDNSRRNNRWTHSPPNSIAKQNGGQRFDAIFEISSGHKNRGFNRIKNLFSEVFLIASRFVLAKTKKKNILGLSAL